MPFAIASASASSSKRRHASTGPKISSCAIVISGRTSAKTVGRTKFPRAFAPSDVALAAGERAARPPPARRCT